MQIEYNKSLQKLNTFGFEQNAERYIEIDAAERLNEVVEHANHNKWPIFILGGGSNLVLSKDIPGLVIKLTNQHLHYENRGEENSWLFRLVAGAGANWHQTVRDSTSRGLYGIENLSLIPGCVGAAPVQNIGAYGVEIADRFESLRALHLESNQWHTFTKKDCEFDYRNSFFKQHKNEFAIFSVNLMLGNDMPMNTSYESLAEALTTLDSEDLTPGIISDTVIQIRQSKLPDPNELGNAGSFFQNPIVSQDTYSSLVAKHPQLVAQVQADSSVKLSAAWLIDSLGWRGKSLKNVGVYEKQALVLVHRGGGQGAEVIELSQAIQKDVEKFYGVSLLVEPIVI